MEGGDSSNDLRDLVCELRRLTDALVALSVTEGLTREAYAIKELRRVVPWSPATTYFLLQQNELKAKVLNLSDANERSGRTMILREDLLTFLRGLPNYQPMRERIQKAIKPHHETADLNAEDEEEGNGTQKATKPEAGTPRAEARRLPCAGRRLSCSRRDDPENA